MKIIKLMVNYLFVENDTKLDGFLRNMRTYLERNSNKIIKSLADKDITLKYA
jgi:hypothetical protein